MKKWLFCASLIVLSVWLYAFAMIYVHYFNQAHHMESWPRGHFFPKLEMVY